jgi:Spy/CpxP family protein refolding chaperone
MRLQAFRAAAVASALIATLASSGVAAHSDGGSDKHGGMHGSDGGSMMGGDRSSMEAPVGMPGRGMMGGHGMMHGGGMMMGGPGMMGHMGSMGGMAPYTAVMLGLSDEQMEKVHQIRDDRMGDYWNLMRQMHGSMRGFMSAWSQPDPEPSEVGAMYARVSEVKRKMVELQAEMRRAVRDVLTADQRERLDEMRGGHGQGR